jgi:hypothetical protein
MSVGDDGVRLNEALLLGFIYRLAGVGNHRCVSISAPISFVTFLLGEQKKSKKYHLHPGNTPVRGCLFVATRTIIKSTTPLGVAY